MTDDKTALRALLEKGYETTFLREMIGFAAERLMARYFEHRGGAAWCGREHRRAENARQMAVPGAF